MQNIQLNRTQATEITFEMELDGLPATIQSEIDVRFTVKCGSYSMYVLAESAPENVYNVLFPSLSFLGDEVTGCEYEIEVITQGYYFKPLNGTAELVESVSVVRITTPHVVGTPVPSEDQTEDEEQVAINNVDDTVPKPDDIPFVFANNTRDFNEVDLDSLPKGVTEEEPITPTEEVVNDTLDTPTVDEPVTDEVAPVEDKVPEENLPFPGAKPFKSKTPETEEPITTTSPEDKKAKLQGILKDLKKEKERKEEKIGEEARIKKQARLEELMEQRKRSEKVRQIIAETKQNKDTPL